jgi:hypothetical protein
MKYGLALSALVGLLVFSQAPSLARGKTTKAPPVPQGYAIFSTTDGDWQGTSGFVSVGGGYQWAGTAPSSDDYPSDCDSIPGLTVVGGNSNANGSIYMQGYFLGEDSEPVVYLQYLEPEDGTTYEEIIPVPFFDAPVPNFFFNPETGAFTWAQQVNAFNTGSTLARLTFVDYAAAEGDCEDEAVYDLITGLAINGVSYHANPQVAPYYLSF